MLPQTSAVSPFELYMFSLIQAAGKTPKTTTAPNEILCVVSENTAMLRTICCRVGLTAAG